MKKLWIQKPSSSSPSNCRQATGPLTEQAAYPDPAMPTAAQAFVKSPQHVFLCPDEQLLVYITELRTHSSDL